MTSVALVLCGGSFAGGDYAAFHQLRQAGLESVWVAHVPVAPPLFEFPQISLFVSPRQVRTYYELVEGPRRTVFSGPRAQRNADIQQRIAALSGREAKIEVREVPLISLLAKNLSGSLQMLDAETGERRWGLAVGAPGAAEFAATMNDDYVVTIDVARMFVITSDTGQLIFERRLDGAPGFGPVLAGDRVMIPKVKGTFAVYRLEESKRNWGAKTITSFGRAVAQPVLAPSGLLWNTDRQAVFLADAKTGTTNLKVRGRSQIVGAPAFRAAAENSNKNQVFVAFEDGYVLGLDARTGNPIWESLIEDLPSDGPYVAGEMVLVATAHGQLFALHADSGVELWRAYGISHVGAHNADTIYAQSRTNQLLLLDSQTGQLRAAVNLDSNERLVPNVFTDRVYLATRRGRIRCLRPANALWPSIHVVLPDLIAHHEDEEGSLEGVPDGRPSATRPTEPVSPAADRDLPDEEPGTSPMDEDPFGLDDDDPFGG